MNSPNYILYRFIPKKNKEVKNISNEQYCVVDQIIPNQNEIVDIKDYAQINIRRIPIKQGKSHDGGVHF